MNCPADGESGCGTEVDGTAEVSVYQAVGAVIVQVSGEIDLVNVATLRAALDAAVVSGSRRVLVDLAAVSFLDVTAARALVAAAATITRDDRRQFTVLNPSDLALRVLTATGLDQLVSISRCQPDGP